MNGNLTFGSVFSGVGMLDFGLCLTGIDHAWFCEFDDWRREEILAQRWPDQPLYKDIREIGADDVGLVDGIVGGFPCKGASTAGKRNGFEHPETVLWREQFRLIRDLRPRYVLVENVANILALHRGAVWGEVLRDLASVGLRVWWDCVPAAAVGAPHRRDRVFAVAADPSRIGGQGSRPEREALVGVGTDRGGALADADHERREERHGSAGPVGSELPGSADRRDRPVANPAGGSAGRLAQDSARGLAAVADGGRPASPDPERECRERRGAAGDVAGEGREVEGEARERQRGRDAAVDRRAVAAHADEEQRSSGHGEEPQERAGHLSDPGRRDPRVERISVDWGKYTGAVQRWEHVFGAAPEPLIRRVDDGGARRVDRSRLSALGDGVQVQVGQFVGAFIQRLDRGEVTSR
ncbi:MAG: DNA cytosine methyltransferase [Solirubrobacterales bacterium]|nr:DNA cytosine methyltransferase [Solirubrobacterales bacterium]